MRGYRSPISVRNIANNLDDATVEALPQHVGTMSPYFMNIL